MIIVYWWLNIIHDWLLTIDYRWLLIIDYKEPKEINYNLSTSKFISTPIMCRLKYII